MAEESLSATEKAPTSEPPSKTRAVGDTQKEALEAQHNHFILSLQNAQMIRQLQAVAWHTFITPPEIVNEAIATNKKHADLTRGQSGHKHGPQHVQIYRAFLSSLLNAIASKDIDKDLNQEIAAQTKFIREHLQAYEKAGVKQGWRSVAQIRVRLAKDGKGVLNFALSTAMGPMEKFALVNALIDTLLFIGAETKPGPPPRSDAERKAQDNIDALKTRLGVKKQK